MKILWPTLSVIAVLAATFIVQSKRSSISSKQLTWDEWFDGPGVSSDFMAERNQLTV